MTDSNPVVSNNIFYSNLINFEINQGIGSRPILTHGVATSNEILKTNFNNWMTDYWVFSNDKYPKLKIKELLSD